MPARSEDCNDAPAARSAADRGECAALQLAMGQARESLASLTLRGTTRVARAKKCDRLLPQKSSVRSVDPGAGERTRRSASAPRRASAPDSATAGYVVSTAITRIPAAFPAATGGESSTTTQSLGATPRRPAAIRYSSGY